jgi:hypothetical protein
MKSFEARWRRFSLVEQLANIGSEVSRTIVWKKKDKPYARKAYFRALDLFWLTVEDPKNRGRLKEIVRVREMLNDWFMETKYYKSSDKEWDRYFLQFAMAARLRR